MHAVRVKWPFRALKPGSDQYFEVSPEKRSAVSSQATRLKNTEGMEFIIRTAIDQLTGKKFLGCWRLK